MSDLTTTPKTWTVVEGEHNGFYAPVAFIAPNGFRIELKGKRECLRALWEFTLGGRTWVVGDGSKLKLDAYGEIRVLDTDKWINPEFDYDAPVASIISLSHVILKYLESVIVE